MIRNDNEYQKSKVQLSEYEAAMAAVVDTDDGDWVRKGAIDALQSQLDSLKSDIDEYDAWVHLSKQKIKWVGLGSIGEMLISARLSRGLSQAALAKKCRWNEHVISQYESKHYTSAPLEQVRTVAEALEVEDRVEGFVQIG